jgi:hypothetical protein
MNDKEMLEYINKSWIKWAALFVVLFLVLFAILFSIDFYTLILHPTTPPLAKGDKDLGAGMYAVDKTLIIDPLCALITSTMVTIIIYIASKIKESYSDKEGIG